MYRYFCYLVILLSAGMSNSLLAQTHAPGTWRNNFHDPDLTVNRNFPTDQPMFDTYANELGVHMIIRDLDSNGDVTNKYVLLGNEGEVYAESSFPDFDFGDVRIVASTDQVFVVAFNRASNRLVLRVADIVFDPYEATDVSLGNWNTSLNTFDPGTSDLKLSDLTLNGNKIHAVYESNNEVYYVSYNTAADQWLSSALLLTDGTDPGENEGYKPVLEVQDNIAHVFWLHQYIPQPNVSEYRIMGREVVITDNSLHDIDLFVFRSDRVHPNGTPSKFYDIDMLQDEVNNNLHVVARFYQYTASQLQYTGTRYIIKDFNGNFDEGAFGVGSAGTNNVSNMHIGIGLVRTYTDNNIFNTEYSVVYTIGDQNDPSKFTLKRMYRHATSAIDFWLTPLNETINTNINRAGYGLQVSTNSAGLHAVWETQKTIGGGGRSTSEIGEIWSNRFVAAIPPDEVGESISEISNYWTNEIFINGSGVINTATISQDATVVIDADAHLFLQGKDLVVKGVLYYDPSHVTGAGGTISTDGIGLLVDRINAPAPPKNLEAESLCNQCEVELSWDANIESDMIGGVYKVYRDEVYNSTGWSLGFEHVATVNHPTSGSTVSWIDTESVSNIGDRTLHYKIIAVDHTGKTSGWSNEVQIYAKIPKTAADESDVPVNEYFLGENYPNPFNPATTLAFDLPAPSDVRLAVYDLQGRLVKTVAAGRYEAGRHSAVWDGSDDAGNPVSSGVYFYRLTVQNGAVPFVQTRKMLLVR